MDDHRYQSLSCSLHDRLEAAATLKRTVRICYLAADGGQVEERVAIADIQTRDGAEYLLLSSGTQVRLDRIISVDDVAFQN
ncbi:MAG TPA: hypothetical protein VK929_13915 [Longimicrobiales bacterium]|nr:hypothetical protein [Longimicrobiales bacterium]